MIAMAITDVLAALDAVRKTAPDRWLAQCPAHPDRSPSLSIREMDDGRVLLHCFASCETEAVLEAISLPMTVLFPKGSAEHAYKGTGGGIPAKDLLVILDHELTVAWFILNEIVEKRTVSKSEVERLSQAAQRVGKARAMANPAKASA